MSQFNQSTVLFFALSTPLEGSTPRDTEVRFHTGVGSLYPPGMPSPSTRPAGEPLTGYWHSFVGVGGLISISEAANANTTTSNEFTIQLAIPNEMRRQQATVDLLNAAARLKLEDQDACVFVVDFDGHLPNQLTEQPELLFTARVSNVSMDAKHISLSCYTAASQLDKVHEHPTVWNDFQQKVNKGRSEDWGFRFTNLTGEEAELNFP